jgi:hypothetical protein
MTEKTAKRGDKFQPIDRVALFDTESGEVLDASSLIYIPKKARIGGFFMGIQHEFEFLAQKKLNGSSLNVLLYLMAKMDYENDVRVSPKQISEKLNMDLSWVYKALRTLKDEGLLDEPGYASLRVNINLAWKGKVSNMKKEIKASEKKRELEQERLSESSDDSLVQAC